MLTRIVLILLFCTSACTSSSEPPSGDKKGGPFLRCALLPSKTGKETFKLPPLLVKRDGYDLEIKGLDRGVLVIGVLAGIHELDPATANNLELFLERFKAAGAKAIVVVGGLGLESGNVTRILDALAESSVPVLLVPGAEESLETFRAAVLSVRKKSPQLIDMTLVRRVRMGKVSLVSLPGYYNSFYLDAKEHGCSYESGDLSDVAGLVQNGWTNVLLSPSPPKGKGRNAVDMGRGGVNIGDPALSSFMKQNEINFGLFGHVYESGGNATNYDGETSVFEGVWQDSLFLQTGEVSAVPLPLENGGMCVGMANIVEFSGSRGRFRTIFAEPKGS